MAACCVRRQLRGDHLDPAVVRSRREFHPTATADPDGHELAGLGPPLPSIGQRPTQSTGFPPVRNLLQRFRDSGTPDSGPTSKWPCARRCTAESRLAAERPEPSAVAAAGTRLLWSRSGIRSTTGRPGKAALRPIVRCPAGASARWPSSPFLPRRAHGPTASASSRAGTTRSSRNPARSVTRPATTFRGETNEGVLRRGLVAFDVASAIPAGSTISSRR